MSTSSLPDGDAQTSAFFRDCTPAEDCKGAIEKSDLRVRRFWELVGELSSVRKRAERAIIVSQKARHIARLAQILRETKSVSLRMTSHQNNLQSGAGADMIREP
jgi:hypothetical protein